jgi:hypothetical protein
VKKLFSGGAVFLVLGISALGLADSTPAKAGSEAVNPAHLVRLGGGVSFPSNGRGWITEHLEMGYLGVASYDRFLAPRWALEAGFSFLSNPVDTSGTQISDKTVLVDNLGVHVGLRGDWLARKQWRLYADLGAGYYRSLLLADGHQEDTANGWGLPVGLGGEVFLPARLSLDLRGGYLPLFMSRGASFNSWQVQLLVGTYWGKVQSRPARPRERREKDLLKDLRP